MGDGERTAGAVEVVNCPDATPTPAAATVSRGNRACAGLIDQEPSRQA